MEFVKHRMKLKKNSLSKVNKIGQFGNKLLYFYADINRKIRLYFKLDIIYMQFMPDGHQNHQNALYWIFIY